MDSVYLTVENFSNFHHVESFLFVQILVPVGDLRTFSFEYYRLHLETLNAKIFIKHFLYFQSLYLGEASRAFEFLHLSSIDIEAFNQRNDGICFHCVRITNANCLKGEVSGSYIQTIQTNK